MATAISCASAPAASACPVAGPSATPAESRSQFAFAQIQCDVCLVQMSPKDVLATASALSAVEAKVFRHEFITIFRFSHPAVVHPNDFRILELIDEANLLHEEENETVFLSRDMMARLQQLTMRRHSSHHSHHPHHHHTLPLPHPHTLPHPRFGLPRGPYSDPRRRSLQ